MDVWTVISIGFGTAVLWLTLRWRRGATTSEPRCGRCGYIVLGLPGRVCPECGSDLQAVGVARGTVRQAPPRWATPVAWSLFAWFAVLVPTEQVWWQFGDRFPRDYDIRLSRSLTPRSRGYQQISVGYWSRTRGHNPPPSLLTVTLDPLSGPARSIELVGPQLRYRSNASVGGTTGADSPMNPSLLKDWLLHCGVPNSPSLESEAGDVLQVARFMTSHPAGTHTHFGTMTPDIWSGGGEPIAYQAYPQAWAVYAPESFAAVVWAIGLISLLRRKDPRNHQPAQGHMRHGPPERAPA